MQITPRKKLHANSVFLDFDIANLNKFPEVCITALSTKQIFPDLYYGLRMIPIKLEVKLSISLLTQEEVETFQQFWYSKLNNMDEPFLIDLPILGEVYDENKPPVLDPKLAGVEEYVVQMYGDLNASWKNYKFPKQETFTLQILNNIEEMFNKNRLDITAITESNEVSFITDKAGFVDWGDGIISPYAAGLVEGEAFGYFKITSIYEVTKVTLFGDYITEVHITRGYDLINADHMCADLPELFKCTIVATPNLITTESMFENTPKMVFAPVDMDLSNVTTIAAMYKNSGIPIVDMDTSNVSIFTEVFKDAILLQCISRLNTLNQTDTTDMFVNTPKLVYPDATDQALILAGADWTSPVSCPAFIFTWLQWMRFDIDNIKEEFTNLDNAHTDMHMLVSNGYGGNGTTKGTVPVIANKKFTEMRHITATFKYKTISDPIHCADGLLVTAYPLADGDNLIIVRDDGSVNEVVASGVTETTASTAPTYPANGDMENGNVNGWDGDITFRSHIDGRDNVGEVYFPNDYKSQAHYDNITLVVGDIYEFSIWYKMERDSSYGEYSIGYSPALYYSSNDAPILDMVEGIEGQSMPWTKYTKTFTATQNRCYILIWAYAGNAFVDTAKLVNTSSGGGGSITGYQMPTYPGETPNRVFMVDNKVEFDLNGTMVEAVKNTTNYIHGVTAIDPKDPLGDGSLVARYLLEGDGSDLQNRFNGVNTGVVFVQDTYLNRQVGDFRAGLSKIQTQFRTSDIGMTYTIIFWARRFGWNSYDVPFIESGSGTEYAFDGRDDKSFDSNSGGGHYDYDRDDGVKVLMDKYTNMDNWNMYAYSRTNGVSNSNFLNGVRLRKLNAQFMRGNSTHPFQIGSDGHYKSDNFNGYISDVMIFDRELTDDEMMQIYLPSSKDLSVVITYDDISAANGTTLLKTKITLEGMGDEFHFLEAELGGRGV